MDFAIKTTITLGPDRGHHGPQGPGHHGPGGHGPHGPGGHGPHGPGGGFTTVDSYSRELFARYDWNRDGRIDRREQQVAGYRAERFFQIAEGGNQGHGDRWGVDPYEVRRAVEWQIDRNHDRMIDGFERRAAAIDFGF